MSLKKDFHLAEDGTFIINNYNRTSPFSNFLPAVAGKWGVPLWAFYVNRAQGLISFGVQDKNNAIAEFYPADRAYRVAPTVGFRTFIKIGNKSFEPFSPATANVNKQSMAITSYDMTIEEENSEHKIKTTANYFTLPNSPFSSLIRELKIKNLSSKTVKLQFIDGLPRIIPFGEQDIFLKFLSRTIEAWACADIKDNMGLYKLIVDPTDVAQTKFIEGANFYIPVQADKKDSKAKIIIDPATVFGMDTSFTNPENFLKKDYSYSSKQVGCGRTPCALSLVEWELKKGEEKTLYSMFGAVFTQAMLKRVNKMVNAKFIAEKKLENKELIEKIKNNALCVSSSRTFNNYVQSTYLDNILRGGYPYSNSGNKSYYIFSRKHGDLERDYNKFNISASYFSEGEANYRDVNQNRRMDLFFNPFIDKTNVVYFLNLLKIDGYNPLVVQGEKLLLTKKETAKICKDFKIDQSSKVVSMMNKGAFLGEIFNELMKEGTQIKNKEKLLHAVLNSSQRVPQATFGEGCWIDHWRYNIDLIEGFLYFFPDKKKELFLETEFMFFDDEYRVKKHIERYRLQDKKVYQRDSVEAVEEKKELIELRKTFKNVLHIDHGKGKVFKTTLFVKLLSLALNKIASLDPYGIGIEMEAGKPGWCDSLNGLPALFGSSICETMELKRLFQLMIEMIGQLDEKKTVNVADEVCDFFYGAKELLDKYFKTQANRDYIWWKKSNEIKDKFREHTFFGLSGTGSEITLAKISEFAKLAIKKLDLGIKQAKDKKTSLYGTYFFYSCEKYEKTADGIIPKEFKRHDIALFLEASVHALRSEKDHDLVTNMRKSPLYDKKLKMYRLNASLKDNPLEIGRSRVFPPGWLENESIWLHMEYKYILELLKNGFYEDFYKDFHNCVVCFFDPHVYGRNVLENSSFIASSAHPDKSYWGKGFVARLTGATVELMHMWILMSLGRNPFSLDNNGKVTMKFEPLLKKELFTTKTAYCQIRGDKFNLPANSFAFNLFSSVLVVYHNPLKKDGWKTKVSKIVVEKKDGKKLTINASVIDEKLTKEIREKKIRRIDVYLK